MSTSSPHTVCKPDLADWRAGGRRSSGRIGANHAALIRVEVTLARHVLGHRAGGNRVRLIVRAGGVREYIAALGASGQHGVNQVRGRRSGGAAACRT